MTGDAEHSLYYRSLPPSPHPQYKQYSPQTPSSPISIPAKQNREQPARKNHHHHHHHPYHETNEIESENETIATSNSSSIIPAPSIISREQFQSLSRYKDIKSTVFKFPQHQTYLPLPPLDYLETSTDPQLYPSSSPHDISMSKVTSAKQEDVEQAQENDDCPHRQDSPPPSNDVSFSLALGILKTMGSGPSESTPADQPTDKRQKQEPQLNTMTTTLGPKKCEALIRKRRRRRAVSLDVSRAWKYLEDEALCDIFTRVPRSEQPEVVTNRLLGRTFEEAQLRWFSELGPFVLGRPWSAEEIDRVRELEVGIGKREEAVAERDWVIKAREFEGRSVFGLISRWGVVRGRSNLVGASISS